MLVAHKEGIQSIFEEKGRAGVTKKLEFQISEYRPDGSKTTLDTAKNSSITHSQELRFLMGNQHKGI